MKYTIFHFLKSQLSKTPPVPVADLTGKVVLVTGSGVGGMGYEAVKHFSTMNPAKIIIAVRSTKRGQEAVDKLREETGYSKAEVAVLDLSDFASVVAFADKMNAEQERLDILVANAAVAYFASHQFTKDGWEETIQVNVLSTLLSAVLLLPLMQRTARLSETQPRIVIVGSGMHYAARFDQELVHQQSPLKALSDKDSKWSTPAEMAARYNQSKLLDLFIARALSNATANTPIIVNNVCPGYCYSALRRDASTIYNIIFRLLEITLARTTEEGSRQFVWAALAPNDGERMRGAYIDNMRVSEPSDYSLSQEGLAAQDKFWNDMLKEITLVDKRVPGILKALDD